MEHIEAKVRVLHRILITPGVILLKPITFQSYTDFTTFYHFVIGFYPFKMFRLYMEEPYRDFGCANETFMALLLFGEPYPDFIISPPAVFGIKNIAVRTLLYLDLVECANELGELVDNTNCRETFRPLSFRIQDSGARAFVFGWAKLTMFIVT